MNPSFEIADEPCGDYYERATVRALHAAREMIAMAILIEVRLENMAKVGALIDKAHANLCEAETFLLRVVGN